MTALQPTFSYHALDEETHEIRLLELIARIGDKQDETSIDEIHSELVHVKYRSTPADQDVSPPGLDNSQRGWGTFAALSYVWGSPELPKRHIFLSGVKVEITLNLHNAFTRLLRLMREDDDFPRRVWVDAICIDQSSVDERNKQVPRMRYIYGAASIVVCSLPPQWRITDKGEAKARTMGWDAGARMMKLLAAAQSDVGAKTFAGHLSTGAVCYSAERWASLFNFFANPYWTRLWIIQEIALASKDIIVLAGGSNTIPWQTVSHAATLFQGLPYHVREAILASIRASGKGTAPFSTNLDKIVDIQKLLSQRLQDQKYAHPSTAIRLARKAQATNVKDKVYGLLGLVDPSISRMIQVDYNKMAATVWTEFASAVVSTTGSLDILPHCSQPDHNRARGAPSWIPDLANGNVAVPFGNRRTTQNFASEASHPSINGGVLSVSGACLDSIVSVSSVRREFDDLFLNADTQRGIVQSPRPPGEDTQRRQRNIEDIYGELAWTLLIGSRGLSSVGLYQELPPLEWLKQKTSKSRSVDRIVSFLEQNGEFLLPGGHLLKDVLEQHHPRIEAADGAAAQRDGLSEDDRYLQIVDSIDSILNYRRLTVTRNARIALAPCDTRPDDCVYALSGYHGLGVLRKQRDGWRWVGSCYVHGLTDRDAIKGRREDDVEQVWII